MKPNRIDNNIINTFLSGKDPMERIVNLEYNYTNNFIKVLHRNTAGKKVANHEPFYPFLWAKRSACEKLCNGDREKVKELMREFNIGIKVLITQNERSEAINDRMTNGYIFMFYAHSPMTYSRFLKFFEEAENPVFRRFNDKNNNIPISKEEQKQYLSVTPVEQFMIQTGKRLFKGYEDYDNLVRLSFDIETEGLDFNNHRINQIGIRTNKGYEKILTVEGDSKQERDYSECCVIEEFVKIIAELNPDVITGHNSENFDWEYIIGRCDILSLNMLDISKKYFNGESISKSKRQTVLKLGGETEYFRKTNVPTINVTDSLHAVRRAQAIDSNMQLANLKYVTKYSKLNKPNRVYVPGDKISETWGNVIDDYAHNNENGDWYKITNETPLKEGYSIVKGKYIVERYLLDDLYETDKVELRYNQSNFLLCKLLPTTFGKACTMGTAATWKMLMLAWSYENNIAIPAYGKAGKFTGGLSRLLSVGFVDRIVKLDFNSLYPAIILTWDIATELDVTGVMLSLLEFILSEREKFKELKGVAGGTAKKIKGQLINFNGTDEEIKKIQEEILKWESESAANDKKQLPFKIFGNSFFGGFGAPDLFNWGDLPCAEKTTCIGRQSLRLMVYWFGERNYEPIVGDSVTGDTPLFIKYNNTNVIDIRAIEDIIDVENIEVDALGREYDTSKKPYKVLCRSGWAEPTYIYRHKTDKDMYRVADGNCISDVTEDHSLFDDNQEKLTPNNINNETKLEYHNHNINSNIFENVSKDFIILMAKKLGDFEIDKVPIQILNTNIENKILFLNSFMKFNKDNELSLKNRSKVCLSGLLLIKNEIECQED